MSHTQLQQAVKQLKLKAERFKISSIASQRTEADSHDSGFFYFETLDRFILKERESKAATRSLQVTQQLEKIAGYFRSRGAVAKVEVDEELLKDETILDELSSLDSLHNGIYSLTLRWLRNNLKKLDVSEDSPSYPLKFVTRNNSEAVPDGTDRKLFPLTMTPIVSKDTLDMEDQERDAHVTRQLAWIDALRLTAPEKRECLSELAVQHVCGAALKKVFHIPGAEVYSDKNLPQYQELMMAPNKYPPKADFVTLQLLEGQPENYFSPALIAGEAKKYDTGKAKETGPNYRSQLQAAVYPSLVLLLLLHTRTYGKAEKDLPEDSFVYGIYYDETTVEVYAHFPYWNEANINVNDRKEGWRFAQIFVGAFPIATKKDPSPLSALRRVQLAVALQAARTHGEQLGRRFNSDTYREQWEKVKGMLGSKPSSLKKQDTTMPTVVEVAQSLPNAKAKSKN